MLHVMIAVTFVTFSSHLFLLIKVNPAPEAYLQDKYTNLLSNLSLSE